MADKMFKMKFSLQVISLQVSILNSRTMETFLIFLTFMKFSEKIWGKIIGRHLLAPIPTSVVGASGLGNPESAAVT